MENKLNELNEIMAEVMDLYMANSVMAWDQETYMPDGGADARGHAMATVGKMAHQRFTDDKVGKLLEELTPFADELAPDSNEARLIKFTKREFDKMTKVPAEMVAEQARITSAAKIAWRDARGQDNYKLFQPHLAKVIDWVRRYAELFDYEHIYDPLLDRYEPGMKTTEVKAIFDAIRPQQIALIEQITAKPEVDDSVLFLHYPEEIQLQVGREVITAYGYDWHRGRQDKVHHPFMQTLGYGDNRITYRVDENFFNPYLFAIMHEAGHAMYEQGITEDLARTLLYDGTSMAIHESQSRMWENLVGRSKPFWQWYYPKLQEYFPSQLGNVEMDIFYKAVNKVKPSFIRVEADEATYNLHIMLRLGLEIEMLEGSISLDDLPEIWKSRFEEYLGIVPPSDADGVLQDIHWSMGHYGYFSTYALGNLVSVQLWDRMKEDHPDIEEQISKGQFKNLFDWMNEKIYQHGSKYEPKELIKRVTGQDMDGQPYIAYLEKKFGEIYEF